MAQPDFAAEFFQQSFEPGTVTTGFQSHDDVATELRVKSTHRCFVLVLQLLEQHFATISCQITDGLLSCMKVNADIYFLHSASFQSHVTRAVRESSTHEWRRCFITSGFELARTLGTNHNRVLTLKGFANHQTLTG